MIRPPPRTFADYLAIALCPILIFLMTGAVVFFLLKIAFIESVGQLYWVFFWFVLAIVAISRIAIEKSSDSAVVYGMLLAVVVLFRVTATVGFHPTIFLVTALIWWMTNRLVLACTHWEDQTDQDAGFTKSISLLQSWLRPAGLKKVGLEKTVGRAVPKLPQRLVTEKSPDKKNRQANHPEWWIFLAAVGAIPLFGFGERWLAPIERERGFLLLLLYLASSFGLLLATSFLARRHQWRLRFITMPPMLAFLWIREGIVIVVGVLLIAFFLPRPETSFSAGSIYRQMVQKLNGKVEVPNSTLTELSSKLLPSDKPSSQSTPAKANPIPQKSPIPQPILDKAKTHWSRWILLAGGLALLVFLVYLMRKEISALLKRRQKPAAPPGPVTQEDAANQFRRMRNPFASNEWEKMDPVELLNYTHRGMTVWAQSCGMTIGAHMSAEETAERVIAKNETIQNESELFVRALLAANFGGRNANPASIEAMRRLWSHWKATR